MMQCPNDAATLVMSERSGIEIDYCPECRGIWLDRGELDKLIERADQPQPGYGQPQPGYGQQQYGQEPYDGHRQPHDRQPHDRQSGSSDTVGRIADKVMRSVQQRSSGQRGEQHGRDRDNRDRDNRDNRGSRGWLGDILG